MKALESHATFLLANAIARRTGSVDPARFPDETFELLSIPAFDAGEPEIRKGREIGSSKQVVYEGDVLLSKIVPHIRRTWVVRPKTSHRLIASGEWIVFRSNEFDPDYLRHALVSDGFHSQFMQTVSGVGGSLLRARPAEVAKISIPHPSINEQKRIAAILDKADSLRRKRQQAIRLADDFLRAVFLDMFGDPVTNPKGWPISDLSALGRVSTGRTPPGDKPGMFDGETPFVTPGDLENDAPTKRSLTEAGVAEVSTVRPGAALVCCIGATIGKMGKARKLSAFNQQINAVEWGDSVNDDYGLSALSFFKSEIARQGASTTLPILKKSLFEKIQIPVPPMELQKRFATKEPLIN